MKNRSNEFVVLSDGIKKVTTVHNVVSDGMLSYQVGFIVIDGVHSIPVSREGREGSLHIWQEVNAPTIPALEMSDLFVTETRGGYWKYHATLRETSFDAYSRYSQDDAIKNVCGRIIGALDGSYDPLLLTFRGWICMVWRDPDHRWGYSITSPGNDSAQPLEAQFSGCSSRVEAERLARLFLAWKAWDGKEESSPLLTQPEDQEQFAQLIRRQQTQSEEGL